MPHATGLGRLAPLCLVFLMHGPSYKVVGFFVFGPVGLQVLELFEALAEQKRVGGNLVADGGRGLHAVVMSRPHHERRVQLLQALEAFPLLFRVAWGKFEAAVFVQINLDKFLY